MGSTLTAHPEVEANDRVGLPERVTVDDLEHAWATAHQRPDFADPLTLDATSSEWFQPGVLATLIAHMAKRHRSGMPTILNRPSSTSCQDFLAALRFDSALENALEAPLPGGALPPSGTRYGDEYPSRRQPGQQLSEGKHAYQKLLPFYTTWRHDSSSRLEDRFKGEELRGRRLSTMVIPLPPVGIEYTPGSGRTPRST